MLDKIQIKWLSLVVGISAFPTVFIIKFILRHLEDRKALKAVLSQIKALEMPVSRGTFYDLFENQQHELATIEDKHKVRVKMDCDTSSNNFSVAVSGFKGYVEPAFDELKLLLAEISKVGTKEIFVPSHVMEALDLRHLIQSTLATENPELHATTECLNENLSLSGTCSQVRRTEEFLYELLTNFYSKNFSIKVSSKLASSSAGSQFDVYVSAVKDVDSFWVQAVDENASLLDELQDDLAINFEKLNPLASIINGTFCAAPYYDAGDCNYFRAKISDKGTTNAKECYVEYVDYGDGAVVPRGGLRELKPHQCELAAQAHKCRLASFDRSSGSAVSKVQLETFERLCLLNQWVALRMIVVENDVDDNCLTVRLFNKNSNVEITLNLL